MEVGLLAHRQRRVKHGLLILQTEQALGLIEDLKIKQVLDYYALTRLLVDVISIKQAMIILSSEVIQQSSLVTLMI